LQNLENVPLNIIIEYIKYRWNAKGRHGIHSPFIYNLVTNVFKLPFDGPSKSELTALFSELKKDKRNIRTNDLGAGSKKLNNDRRVSEIFKVSASRGKYGKLLYQLSKHYNVKNILELGTSLGVGTIQLQLGNPNTKITTIEACFETHKIANENFAKFGFSEIKSINTEFGKFLSAPGNTKFDLVFIDGDHNGASLLDYLTKLEPITHEQTLFVLDDIRWSNSMLKAWNSIIEDDRFNVTLDLFRVGIAINRKQQQKEHFQLKL